MPTTRHRYVITETDAVHDALAIAAEQWPEDRGRPSRLVARLLELGQQSLAAQHDERRRTRHDAVARTRGALAGLVSRDEVDALNREWAE